MSEANGSTCEPPYCHCGFELRCPECHGRLPYPPFGAGGESLPDRLMNFLELAQESCCGRLHGPETCSRCKDAAALLLEYRRSMGEVRR